MKIAYVTTYDSSDVHAWSGLGNYMLRSLQETGMQTESVGKLSEGRIPALHARLEKLYYSGLQSRQFLKNREPDILRHYAVQVKKRVAPLCPDVVFSPGTIPIAYLQIEKPVVFWTDSTFAGMVDFYPGFSNLCARTIQNGHQMEQAALSSCRLAIYASEWAAQTAKRHYDVDPAKVKVVPFGANFSSERNVDDVSRIIEEKGFDTCKLLFVGVDWRRKGGDTALAVGELLNQRGVRTELHVVGCVPPVRTPPYVKIHGFISKTTADGRQQLDRLFSQAHFLILPSRAECYGVALAEASSFGLPSLATKVGGIPGVIQDGKNGFTFPIEDGPQAYSDCIESLMSSRDYYRELALSSFAEYQSRLNWHSAGRQVAEYMRDVL